MVVTLTPTLLAAACRQLATHVKTSGYEPTHIIGILTGGAEVARLLRHDFPEAHYSEVRFCRPDSGRKQRGLTHRLLQSLPLWLCDALRTIESRVGEWRSHHSMPVRLGDIPLEHPIAPGSRVLLVDDALDTGATLQKARQQLLAQYPGITVRTAVITVTTARPACDADFCLYHNRTLCRFPWSNDYR